MVDMEKISLETLVEKARKLHCFSETAIRAMEAIDSGDNELTDVAAIIAQDPCLAGRVLQIANSPFYGLSREIGSIKEACVMIGLYTLRGIVVAAGIAGCMAETKQRREEQASLWRHAVGVAAISHVLADYCGEDKEAAFTVGLLHDIGQTVLALCAPKAMARSLTYKDAHLCTINEAEIAVLGFDHCHLGEAIAEQWRLPPKIKIAISHHHQSPQGGASPLADIICLANRLYWNMDSGIDQEAVAQSLDGEALKRIGMDARAIGILLPQIAESRNQAHALLGSLK